jgi:hypothetical protein
VRVIARKELCDVSLDMSWEQLDEYAALMEWKEFLAYLATDLRETERLSLEFGPVRGACWRFLKPRKRVRRRGEGDSGLLCDVSVDAVADFWIGAKVSRVIIIVRLNCDLPPGSCSSLDCETLVLASSVNAILRAADGDGRRLGLSNS